VSGGAVQRVHVQSPPPQRVPRGRAGAVLLEVLVALSILGVMASTAAWRTAEWMHTVHRAHTAEAEVRDAQRLLTAISLWPREDLDRHLGDRPQGAWIVNVDRATPQLYRVTLRDTASRAVALRTTLYRAAER
jgi:type II secretory pathway pseudopilin PulG